MAVDQEPRAPLVPALFRPTMRFVAVKSEEQQASASVFFTRDLVVCQPRQLVNAIRGHLTEYGWVALRGRSYVALFGNLLEEELGSSLPEAARAMVRVVFPMIEKLDFRIAEIDTEIAKRAREN